jgi:hypothetical protein
MKYPDIQIMDQKSRNQSIYLDKKKFIPLILEIFDYHLY